MIASRESAIAEWSPCSLKCSSVPHSCFVNYNRGIHDNVENKTQQWYIYIYIYIYIYSSRYSQSQRSQWPYKKSLLYRQPVTFSVACLWCSCSYIRPFVLSVQRKWHSSLLAWSCILVISYPGCLIKGLPVSCCYSYHTVNILRSSLARVLTVVNHCFWLLFLQWTE